jgi:hypothetical protein
MLFRWGFLIFLYSLPMFISYFDNIKFEKRWAARQAAEQRINEGTATTDDFIHLYEDDDKEIIIKAFKHGYRKIAGEILTAVCDTSSNRIFGNYVLRLEYLAKYGREIAQKKVLGLWLIEAAEEGLSEGVEVLLAAGADVNLMNSSGNTPLIAAVRICCPNMVRLFLEQGADVNAMNEYERDALFYAVSCHHLVLDKDEDGRGDRLVNIAKLLIEYGADVGRKYQKPDDETYEPLLSFAKQDSEMAELLTRKYR